jgi:hypothetical protein
VMMGSSELGTKWIARTSLAFYYSQRVARADASAQSW